MTHNNDTPPTTTTNTTSPPINITTTNSVANVRKHQLLKPDLKLVATAIDSITPSNYVFDHLAVEDLEGQRTNLQLGFPATVVHVVRPDSPLYNLRWVGGGLMTG